MKIISKFKDYYDYLQGIYGVDLKIVYNRKMVIHKDLKLIKFPLVLSICNTLYVVYKYNDKLYYGDDILKMMEENNISEINIDENKININGIKYLNALHGYSDINLNDINKPISIYYSNIDLCQKYNRLITKTNIYLRDYNLNLLVENPNLSDMKLNNVISANDMFLNLSKILTVKDVENIVVDDKTKIVSNGFDLKTSFRNVK